MLGNWSENTEGEESLSDKITDDAVNTQTETVKKPPKPPPIFIQGVTNFKAMVDTLIKFTEESSFTAKALVNDVVKINVDSPENFRKTVNGLKAGKIAFYTYQLKSERSYKVVIRHLHHTIDSSEIKEALTQEGYEICNVTNIRHSKSKEPLSLFFVDLEPNENNKSIYNLQTLLHTRIQVESPRPRHEIPQCKRCQGFGHTRGYCTLPYICVKCGGEHDNRDCTKSPEAKPKCGLCGGDHTANYRGCSRYKELIKSVNQKEESRPKLFQNTMKRSERNSLRTNRTYRDTVASGTTKRSPPADNKMITQETHSATTDPQETSSGISRLEQLVEKMMKQNAQIMELLTTLMTKVIKLIK